MATKRKREGRVSAREQANREKGGFTLTHINVPGDVTLYDPESPGVKRLEIVPYVVGQGNPSADPGELHYERTYWYHRDVGVNEDRYVCPAKTAGRKCPICEAAAELKRMGNKEGARDLTPKHRQLWNVFDHGNPDAGVQVWEVSFHNFGKQLFARVRDSDEEDGYEFFADPEDGMTLKVGFAYETTETSKYLSASTIDFKPRGKMPKKVLDAATCLDDMLIIEPYEKLRAIFHQEDMDATPSRDDGDDWGDDEPEPKPKPKGGKSKASKPKAKTAEDLGISEGDTVEHPEHGTCTVLKVTPDGTGLTVEDADEDFHKVKVAEITTADAGDNDAASEPAANEPDPEPADDGDGDEGGSDWDDWGDD